MLKRQSPCTTDRVYETTAMVEQLPCVVLSRSKLDFIKIMSIVHFARNRSYFTFSAFRIRGSQLTDKVRDVYFIQHFGLGLREDLHIGWLKALSVDL